MGWISVDDELPGKFNASTTYNVLLWCPEQPRSPVTIGHGVMIDGVNYPFKIKRWVSTAPGCNIIFGKVTHWQPLPDPPKDKL